MKVSAPAKINLTLEVLQRRDDGYHSLRSLMVPLALADELAVEPDASFRFACNDAGLADDANLVVRACRAVDPQALVAVSLDKRIPTQAGLGGGSSDAASTLLAAMRGAFGRQYAHDWIALARSLGSDVPFFLAESGALVEGTGERVVPVGALPPWHVLVVKPPVAVSTAAAYALLDAQPRPSRPRNASVSLQALAALQRGAFSEVERLLCNDFNDPIAGTAEPIARALDALRAAGATNAMLSGSGSAVYTLARDAATIGAIAARLTLDASFLRFPTRFANTPAWRGSIA